MRSEVSLATVLYDPALPCNTLPISRNVAEQGAREVCNGTGTVRVVFRDLLPKALYEMPRVGGNFSRIERMPLPDENPPVPAISIFLR